MPELEHVASLPGHTETAWAVAWNPARSLLASCSTDRTVRLYSYASTPAAADADADAALPSKAAPPPKVQFVQSIETEHKRTVRGVAWAPAGRTFATASFDSTVGIWEEAPGEGVDGDVDDDEGGAGAGAGGQGTGEWECVTTLEGHDSECKSVGFSADGALLASCSRDKSVWVWEDADFECIAVMMDHSQDVKCVAWHPDEEILASASYDSHIHLYYDDPDSDWCAFQKLHPKLPAADLVVTAPAVVDALRPAGAPAPALAGPGTAADEFAVPPLEEDETVWALAWSPCGRYLASAGDCGGIRIWARTGFNPDSPFTEVLHTSAHARPCLSLSWARLGVPAADGGLGLLASAGGDGRVIVWQVSASGTAVAIEPVAAVRDAHGVHDVNCVAWNVRADGRGAGLLATAGDDGAVNVWRVTA